MFLIITFQVVKLREVFPQGHGFVLAFEYMLSDLSEVIRNSEQTLTEVHMLCIYEVAWICAVVL